MSKKLYVGNYRFDPTERVVYVSGNVTIERFLIITNLTDNVIIYNFADPNKGYSGISYSTTTDETALSLKYDVSTMSSTDTLQVFIQGDYQEITPAEDILDPVGKLRISNPENLIDTDFEYGLQATKWETVQTVNNIPTIYSNSGDTPIDGIDKIESIDGSRAVKVTTTIPHGLAVGDPISVQGVAQYQAEGYFVVTNRPSNLTFYFEMDVPAIYTGEIQGSYTTIVPGKFFEGSTLPISIADGAVTDGSDPSNITVTTAETHGFSEDTKLYIRNTVGPRTLSISDSTATAPDGRPFVDSVPSFSYNNNVLSSTDTGRGSYKTNPVVTFDWESTYTHYLTTNEVDTTNDRITWPSHGFRDGYAVLFQSPYTGDTDGGLSDGAVYYVNVIDTNTIQLHTDTGLSSQSLVSLSTLNNTYGLCRLSLVYKVEQANGTSRQTEMGVYAAANSATQTEGVGSGSVNQVTYQINLTEQGFGNPTTLVLNEILLSGDVNSSNEWVEFTIAGQTQQIYAPGNQSQNYATTSTTTGGTPVFNGLDVSSALSVSGSDTILTVQADPNTTVGTFVWSGDRYRFKLDLQVNAAYTDAQKSRSGGDLIDSVYGLGGTLPDNVIAFQGRTFNSYNTNADAYSALTNQNDYGRYGTFAIRNPTVTLTQDPTQNGAFDINFNDNNSNYGSGSQIFYIFVKSLVTDRNTIYIEDHGITSNTQVNVTVDSTAFAAGEVFSFTNNTAGGFDQPQQFTATASFVNDDVIRIQTEQSPFTDDIIRAPSNFTISYTVPNSKYNSVYVANHKINSEIEATYTNVTGNAIPPLVSGDTYNLDRLDDNRLIFADSLNSGSGSTNPEIGSASNSSQSFFIDLSTSLGFVPSTAKITAVDFRGDFSSGAEYVDLDIRNAANTSNVYSVRIGASDDIGDSSTYTTSTTFSPSGDLDISSSLTTNGNGATGFYVNVDPSNNVNFSPGGMPNGFWWQLRFNVDGNAAGLVFTGAGTGSHTFDVASIVGAYDGVFNISNINSSNQFTVSGNFKIPIREYSFTSSNVSTGAGTITFTDAHNLTTGEKVTYDENGGTSILPSGVSDIFAIVISSTTIRLASSQSDALSNSGISITTPDTTQFIRSSNILKSIAGTGSVSTTSGEKEVIGTDTRFLTLFKRFDKIYIDNGAYVQEKTVDIVSTDTKMTLFEDATATTTNNDYYYLSQIALRPDGYNLHKPFDGGVDITAGTSPNGRIARQTRKYFRYQSGKGIQTSFAINFNPPKLVKNLIRASGNTAIVDTQEQHNLSVGDTIIIKDATVSTGVNYYNGTFLVTSVPDPFQFQYVMEGTPTDIRTGGFPTYVRESWTDSYVRGGMFDDQNGFFFEYDGQNLNAVRRSSTKQIAGDINVTRGSQIVTGEGTSFTTQLSVGEKIVIRGQSYLITEISSDIRCIVQPAYRGINATRVKVTKTVDTKTPQSQWNMDKGDGTGFTGYILDTTKIQMAYMDYSWYGAGKIRYGFKDTTGHIRYFHEYRHNNVLDESYFRSGNLPARYEIENGPNATTSPTLFHFGTSIIMDGQFDDDKAYQFTGQSRPMAFTDGGSSTITTNGVSTFQQVTLDGNRVYVYAFQIDDADVSTLSVGHAVTVPGLPTNATYYVTQLENSGGSNTSKVYINYPATTADPTGGTEYSVISGATILTFGETTAVELQRPLPLISVRLAPSVDSGLTGSLGEREVVNRMQLRLRQATVTTNSDIEVFLIQNTIPSEIHYDKAQSPSLSQIIKHSAGDTLIAGTTVFSSKVSAGSFTLDLEDLLEIGNSLLGGDGIFPAGPDLLTLAVQTQSAKQSFTQPFTVSGNISWSESQA